MTMNASTAMRSTTNCRKTLDLNADKAFFIAPDLRYWIRRSDPGDAWRRPYQDCVWFQMGVGATPCVARLVRLNDCREPVLRAALRQALCRTCGCLAG